MKKYTLSKVKPSIYLLNFTTQYDLTMTFLRYQEFYESASAKFRNKTWEILDYMEWYAGENDGVFTYPKDWSGFNIPGWVIEKVEGKGIPDYNKYDEIMMGVFDKLYIGDDGDKLRKFYLIGTYGDGKGVIEHEIAHGLFYTNQGYRKEMKALVSKLPNKVREKIFKALGSMGYSSTVFVDECQAYLSTGVVDDFGNVAKYCGVFEGVFKEYNG